MRFFSYRNPSFHSTQLNSTQIALMLIRCITSHCPATTEAAATYLCTALENQRIIIKADVYFIWCKLWWIWVSLSHSNHISIKLLFAELCILIHIQAALLLLLVYRCMCLYGCGGTRGFVCEFDPLCSCSLWCVGVYPHRPMFLTIVHPFQFMKITLFPWKCKYLQEPSESVYRVYSMCYWVYVYSIQTDQTHKMQTQSSNDHHALVLSWF